MPAYKKAFLGITLFISITATVLYFLIRILFAGYDISLAEDMTNLLQTLGTAVMISIAVFLLYLAVETADILMQQKIRLKWSYAGIAAALISIVVFIVSCSNRKISGIKKDLSTGLTTQYHGLDIQSCTLVMNNEIIHHTDIPLGESFDLVNSGVSGFTVNDGKVQAGCALTITGKNGDTILQDKDLFKNKGSFSEKDAQTLRCSISTGAPMKWDESYNVSVAFWDKLGDGRIENMLTIHTIDIP